MSHPPSRSPEAEKVQSIITAVVVGACLLVWAAGQIAARLWNGTWIPTPLSESPLIFWRLVTDPAHPVEAWSPGAAILLPGPVPYYTTLTAFIVVLGTAGASAYHLISDRSAPDRASARWARPRDLKPLIVRRPQPGRLTLGTVHRRLVATEAQHSVAVIGPAGTGKTTGFAIPALLEWDGP
ncbi:MAG: hypothetical protein WD651_09550, partial [Acidimicrobiia bacterium]